MAEVCKVAMKLITKYLAREIYTVTLTVSVILLGIFLSTQIIRFVHAVLLGELSLRALKWVILLQIPLLFTMVLPTAFFLSVVLTYGRLYADNEMTVLMACGFSGRRLTLTTLGIASVVAALVALLSFCVNQHVYYYSDYLRSSAAQNAVEMVAPHHFSEMVHQNWVFYTQDVDYNQKRFYDIFAFQKHPNSVTKKRMTLVAKQASQIVDAKNGNKYLLLENGYRYLGKPGDLDYEVIKFTKYAFRLPGSGKWKGDESSMSVTKLWKHRFVPQAAAELHWRLSTPLLVLILVFFALACSRQRVRYTSRYARLAPAIMVYLIYLNGLFLGRTWLRDGILAPEYGMWWLHGGMLIWAMFWYWRRFKV